jgi:integrase
MAKKAIISVIEGEVRLYKQPRSPYYFADIKLAEGGRRRISTKERKKKDATKKAIELYYESQNAHKNNIPQDTRLFSAVAKTVVAELESLKETEFWKETYLSYMQVIQNYQIPYFKNTRLTKVRDLVDDYLKDVEKKMGHKIAKSTVSNHMSALKRILQVALQKGWITNASLPEIKIASKASQRRPTFEVDEYNSMRKQLKAYSKKKTHRKRDGSIRELLYDYVLFLANSGVRHGTEALRLTWKQIGKRHQGGSTYIYATVVTFKGRGTKRERQVILRENHAYLQRCIDRNPSLKGKDLETVIGKSDELIFVAINEKNEAFQPSRLDGTFKRFLQEIDMTVGGEGTNRTLYSLRHFYATQELLRNNVSSMMLAQQMGTSVKMLEKHYGHLTVWQKASELSGQMYPVDKI